MQEALGLCLYGLCQAWVDMAQRVDPDTREEIEEGLARFGEESRAQAVG